MSGQCYVGCVTEQLPRMAADGVRAQCCVTSPPYWGLRDYGIPPTDWPDVTFTPVAGLPPMTVPSKSACLGLEPDPWSFVAHLVHVFRLVWPVLADDGVAWLNLGDSYAANGRSGLNEGWAERAESWAGGGHKAEPARNRGKKKIPAGLKLKDLVGQPWRVALALQADGWYLRQEIIWHKPNPMPESCRDRCTKAHEQLFMLTKAPRYYWDREAMQEPATFGEPNSPQSIKSPHGQGYSRRAAVSEDRKALRSDIESRHRSGIPGGQSMQAEPNGMRNRRSVWTVSTRPYAEAHFATFPPALIGPCILATSRPGDVVLDPFLGSGTTAEVAQRLGRKWVGCEANPDYVGMHADRTRLMGLGL